MKILMLTAYFPPELGSASHMFHDLGKEFLARGHSVTVLTGFPKYNVDARHFPPVYGWRLWRREQSDGLKVIRIRTFAMPRNIPMLRGVDQLVTALAFCFSGLFLASGRPDVILLYSPPLFLSLTAFVLRMFKGGMVTLNIQDLFPQSAIDLGVLRNPALVRLFRAVESYAYRHADLIAVHSPGNKDHVVRCGGDPSRTFVIHNPVDVNAIRPGQRVNALRARYKISEHEFVVSFAGVLGYSQDLDTVIESARILQDLTDVVFYIVGDGVEKPRLVEAATDLKNIRFLPMLPKDEYVELLCASDVCLATLRKDVKTPVVPSKILSVMAAGRPLVASMPLAGDAPKIVQDADCGICVEPENPQALADAVRRMHDNRDEAKRFGERGRSFVEKTFSLQHCAESYESAFAKMFQLKQ